MHTKFLDKNERKQVGFDYIINKLKVITPYGQQEKKNIKVFKRDEKEKLIREYDYIELTIEIIEENKEILRDIEEILFKIKDIRNSVKRCKNFNILDEIELYEVKIFSLLNEELRRLIEQLGLSIKDITLKSLDRVIDLLDPEGRRIPTFQIYESYSEKLVEIRKQKCSIEKKIYLEVDEKNIKELKQARLNIIILEKDEELKIKEVISNKLEKEIEKIENNIKSIGRFDFLIAKAKLAIEYKGRKPSIKEKTVMEFDKIFNPEILDILTSMGENFTSTSVNIKSGTTIITGANMGGKSVTLKTIALNLLMGMMGFFIFAKKAAFPILDFIYFVSDDLQSVSKGLSTFGAEIIKLKKIIEDVKEGEGFISLDEFARGTNPIEGSYIVESVSKYLNKFSSISLIATHYDGVAKEDMEHYQVVGLKNVDFGLLKHRINMDKSNSVEIIQNYMDYNLEKIPYNHKVPKDALNISILLGLDEDVIRLTKKYYDKEE